MGLALTNPGIQYEDQQPQIDPQTGQPLPVVPNVKFFKNKAARNSQFLADTEAAVNNTPLTVSDDNSQGPVGAGPVPSLGTPNIPKPVQPSFAQMNTPNPETGQTPTPPAGAETKLGKLVSILGDAARGAAYGAGQPNFGAGFQAATERPIQMAQMRNAVLQQQAQTALTKSQSQMVQTPWGPLPPALAKVLLPAQINSASREKVAQTAAGSRENVAQTGATSRENVAQTGATSRENVAQTGATSRENVANINQGTALPLDPVVANLVGIPEMADKPVGKATLANINKMLTARGYQQKDLGADGMWLTDKAGNKLKRLGDSPSLARAQARPVQIADADNPGNTKYVSGATAIASGAAGTHSASVQVPKAAMKSEVPSKIGDQKLAFNTALQHADLLTSAINALHNGDQQTLNSLKNRFATEFGATGPLNAQTIASAYTREVNKMLSSGHMSDSDLKEIGSTLNVNRQAPAQSLGVINAYKQLAQSKMNVLNQQKQNAISQSQPGGGKVIHYKIQNGALVPVQ
jgi:hypothetical protein